MLRVLRERIRLARSMRRTPEQLVRERDRRLRELVRHAYEQTSFYRRRFDEAGLTPRMIRGESDLSRIPPTTRAELQAAGTRARVSTAFDRDRLEVEKTSGSSGRPLEVHVDASWVATRNAMFLRALGAAGYRLGRRLMLLASGPARTRGWPLAWQYVPFETPPREVLGRIRSFRPSILYGWVTPLRQLAEHIRDTGEASLGVRAVVTTAESLDERTRQLLEHRLGGEVFQIYGLTEMGAVAWECDAHDGLHVADDSTLVECVEGRLVLTNLHLLSSPLLRYDCGDLAAWHDGGPCVCGCPYRRLARVEGRVVDRVRLPDGRMVSPYQFTLALERIGSLSRYQVVQDADDHVEVHYVLAERDPRASHRVEEAVRALVGPDVVVQSTERDSLDPAPGRKFRVVERRVGM